MIDLLQSSVYGAALVFGFRHGFDWDHIAALTDLTGSQRSGRRSMFLATLYALGHAVMVIILGSVAIVFADEVPSSVDAVLQRIVGASLIALGGYIVWALVRYRGEPVMRSRWMVVLAGARRLIARMRHTADQEIVIEHSHPHDHDHQMHEHQHADVGTEPELAGEPTRAPVRVRVNHAHAHRHVSTMPVDPFMSYSPWTSFGIGLLHGISAETPTQVLVFAAAASATGTAASLGVLACFVIGILAANTVVAAGSTFGFRGVVRKRSLYVTLSIATAAFSVVVGGQFMLGRAASLPPVFGG